MSFRKKVLGALGWAIAGKAVAQVVSWAITLVVIRLLTPADYGVMAIAMTFVTLTTMLTDFGLGSALVQIENINELLLRKTLGFVITVGIIATGVVLLGARPIALFFDDPELEPVLSVLSLSIIFSSFSILPTATLCRELDFKNQSIVILASTIIGSLMGLGFAVGGYGVWALVWSHLVITAFKSVGLVVITRSYYVPNFNFRDLGYVVSFGSWLTLERITWTLSSRADVLIIGKVLGKEVLGLYEVGMHIASLPQTKVQGVVNSVAFPAFAKIRSIPQAAETYLLKYIRLSVLISCPVFFGLAAVSSDFVHLVLGEKWIDASISLSIIALAMPLKLVEAALAPYLHALGKVKTSLGNVSIGLVIMVCALIVGSNWGLVGVAVAWAFAITITFCVATYRTTRETSLKTKKVLYAICRAGIPGIAMYFMLIFVDATILGDTGSISNLLILVPSGVVIYILNAWWICKDHVVEVTEMFGLKIPGLSG